MGSGMNNMVYALAASSLATLFTTNPPSPDGLFQWTDNSPPNLSGFYRLLRE